MYLFGSGDGDDVILDLMFNLSLLLNENTQWYISFVTHPISYILIGQTHLWGFNLTIRPKITSLKHSL